jgi:Spy/CpxP family protein refolding chaperone
MRKYQVMKSTKYIAILICFLFSTFSGVAQQRFSKEEFKQQRAAFLKQELDLTPAEAARFIPLSEELMEKKFELNREAREKARTIRNRSNVSDAEYEQVVDAWINSRVKEALLEREYYQKFKRVLPMRKVRKYQEVDMKFMRAMMQRNDNDSGNKPQR